LKEYVRVKPLLKNSKGLFIGAKALFYNIFINKIAPKIYK
jgi:hypothetical protein